MLTYTYPAYVTCIWEEPFQYHLEQCSKLCSCYIKIQMMNVSHHNCIEESQDNWPVKTSETWDLQLLLHKTFLLSQQIYILLCHLSLWVNDRQEKSQCNQQIWYNPACDQSQVQCDVTTGEWRDILVIWEEGYTLYFKCSQQCYFTPLPGGKPYTWYNERSKSDRCLRHCMFDKWCKQPSLWYLSPKSIRQTRLSTHLDIHIRLPGLPGVLHFEYTSIFRSKTLYM
jgi:hypothetical protein